VIFLLDTSLQWQPTLQLKSRYDTGHGREQVRCNANMHLMSIFPQDKSGTVVIGRSNVRWSPWSSWKM